MVQSEFFKYCTSLCSPLQSVLHVGCHYDQDSRVCTPFVQTNTEYLWLEKKLTRNKDGDQNHGSIIFNFLSEEGRKVKQTDSFLTKARDGPKKISVPVINNFMHEYIFPLAREIRKLIMQGWLL